MNTLINIMTLLFLVVQTTQLLPMDRFSRLQRLAKETEALRRNTEASGVYTAKEETAAATLPKQAAEAPRASQAPQQEPWFQSVAQGGKTLRDVAPALQEKVGTLGSEAGVLSEKTKAAFRKTKPAKPARPEQNYLQSMAGRVHDAVAPWFSWLGGSPQKN